MLEGTTGAWTLVGEEFAFWVNNGEQDSSDSFRRGVDANAIQVELLPPAHDASELAARVTWAGRLIRETRSGLTQQDLRTA